MQVTAYVLVFIPAKKDLNFSFSKCRIFTIFAAVYLALVPRFLFYIPNNN